MDEVLHDGECRDSNDNTYGPTIAFPLENLILPKKQERRPLAVLVETGSFNPPTYMHLQMFELGRDALTRYGYHVIGGYMSPVNNGYGKKGLLSAEHRVRMCQLGVEGSSFIMVDPWEALQSTYQRTLTVLARVKDGLRDVAAEFGPIRVMLLCGADLLESFTVPGVWIPHQVEIIVRDYGLVCVPRGGRDVRSLIQGYDLLSKYMENIIIADKFESDISSTRVRDNLAKGLSVDDLTPAGVINYINSNKLYKSEA